MFCLQSSTTSLQNIQEKYITDLSFPLTHCMEDPPKKQQQQQQKKTEKDPPNKIFKKVAFGI